MWPSVPAFRRFGNLACPSGANCELPNCIFSHDAAKAQPANSTTSTSLSSIKEPEAKRLKLSDGAKDSAVQSEHTQSQDAPKSVFVGSIVAQDNKGTEPKGTKSSNSTPSRTAPDGKATDNVLTRTATQPVSPPPKTGETKTAPEPDIAVPLMPRKLAKEPATFTKRLTLLKALHAYMKPLNEKIKRAVKPEIKALCLSDNRLNKLAVDEEEKLATEYAAVYENVLKQRIVKLKAMTPEEWVKGRREALAKGLGVPIKKPAPQKVSTGLTPKEEVIFLSTLISPQAGLDAHGYVTKLQTEAEIEEARAVRQAAGLWEKCDRCSTRFQVFPERREEDGALTTGGQCRHHWGKKIYPKKGQNSGLEPTRLSCCNEPMGAPGCTTHDTHVYKMSDPKQLGVVMPFIKTPENEKAKPHTAVCFDCEMGYTTNGLELLRLTAVSWPTHKPILDVLVRPFGYLLDVNTRFSGVTAKEFVDAKPYDPENPTHNAKDLRIVESPYAARDLFLSLISPKTPVLGHALENDLNCIRLIHPTIVDTVLLYPHRQGLPLRHGLRYLVKTHLGMDIQQAGAAGHDSLEDARATGELIRLKVSEKWKSLKDEGWSIRDDGMFPPLPPGEQPSETYALPAPTAPSMVPTMVTAVLKGNTAEKRKRDEVESP